MKRSGISQEMLTAAGVRQVDAAQSKAAIGFEAPGLLIPYVTRKGHPVKVDGKTFYRVRLNEPKGNAKYLSPAKSGCHIYEPPGLNALLIPGCTLQITEGEFKAMALVEAGFPCIGIGGITAACPRNLKGEAELIPWLNDLIDEHRPARVAFVGDSDTCLIPDFAREAVKLAKLLPCPLILPRIPYDAPGKAADDLRELFGPGFIDHWQGIISKAVPVSKDDEPNALAMRLIRLEADSIARLAGAAKDKSQDKMIAMAVGYHDQPRILAEIEALYASQGMRKAIFRSAVKEALKNLAHEREMARSREAEAKIAIDPEPPLFFDGSSYWRKESDGHFGRMGRDDALMHMANLGLSRRHDSGLLSPAEEQLMVVQRNHRVTAAMPLCGRRAGLYSENGHKILVTNSPRWIQPKEGNIQNIDELLADFFGRSAGDDLWERQLTIFITWLKTARAAVANSIDGIHNHNPGPVLALVGPPDCGKSFIQSHVITPLLGGREEDPGKALLTSDFNANLWKAEHLCLADKALDGNGTQRERLRLELKAIVANSQYPLHPKGKDQITLRPIWRISLTANDDPSSASDLPTLDSSFADKIIYLKCYAPPSPFFDHNIAGAREAFGDSIRSALPAFAFEVDNFAPPDEYRSQRWGVAAWHHPEILDLISDSDPCLPVADEIAAWVRSWENMGEVQGSATELLIRLNEARPGVVRHGLVSGARHFGHLLARISKINNFSFSISQGKRGGASRSWSIVRSK